MFCTIFNKYKVSNVNKVKIIFWSNFLYAYLTFIALKQLVQNVMKYIFNSEGKHQLLYEHLKYIRNILYFVLN